MIIVSDTSCISNLYQINSLYLLSNLFGDVLIPPKVFEELLNFHGKEFEDVLYKEKIVINNLSLLENLIKVREFKLDEGEEEAIALAIEKNCSLIIDEKKGKLAAIKLGLKTVGLLGVLLLAKDKKLIISIKPLLDDLKN
jgi:uncharacterized protein